MAEAILKNIYKCLVEIETALVNSVLQRFLPGELAPALVQLSDFSETQPCQSLPDLLQNSILWAAVPKSRRSAERVRERKFGVPKYVWKPLVPKKNIIICRHCGNYQMAGLLCGTCYARVMAETKEIQTKVAESLGISPIEEDVVVLYEGEENQENSEMWKGKRIIEMKKPRPNIFSQNLLQGSTQRNSQATDVMETPHPLEYK